MNPLDFVGRVWKCGFAPSRPGARSAVPVAMGALALGLGFVACSGPSSSPSSGNDTASAPPPTLPPIASAVPATPPHEHRPPPVREGNALARAAEGGALFLADEDHGVVRRIPLPIAAGTTPMTEREMPGKPAQVLPLDGRVLVTVRDPGLLVILRSDGDQPLSEEARVPVPGDAWGIAVTPDEKIALVTSAWNHAVTAVDLEADKVLWSIDVGREPRGVVVSPDGNSAYVTHLIGDSVTRIEDLHGTPRAGTFSLIRASAKPGPPPKVPPAPRGGSLAYSAVLSPDGSRLFVPRHQVGGDGPTQWFGTPTVTVVLTKDDSLLVPPGSTAYQKGTWSSESSQFQSLLGDGPASFEVARASVLRKSTHSLLLASEATDVLLELDAYSLEPGELPLHKYQLGRHYEEQARAARQGGAPTGIALSEDEKTAYVFCRATYDLVAVPLVQAGETGLYVDTLPASAEPVYTRLAPDPLGEDESVGRRLFYTAMDPDMTDQVSCATCHPEGRDDGLVWTEYEGRFLSRPQIHGFAIEGPARQTPMIAGRVSPEGPYGWLAESPNLKSRIIAGFDLHRWCCGDTVFRSQDVQRDTTARGDPIRKHRADHLALFLRRGLVPPPASFSAPADVVARGKELFEDSKVGCAGCHVPKTDYTNRTAVVLPARPHPPSGYGDPPATGYKTPSLLYVVGTPPYYHDGTAETLEQLVDENGDRMGRTSHLSKPDRAALVAFLKTIGTGALPDGQGPIPAAPDPLVAAPATSVSASASASTAPSAASATASASTDAKARSPMPKPTDWKDAAPFELTRTVRGCTARKLREYVRVRCEPGYDAAYTLAGPTQDQQYWEGKVVEKGMFVTFPLRPGERRLMYFTQSISLGRYGGLSTAGRVITSTWLPGEDPVVDVD